AEDGIRDSSVTGVQTCALPILAADAIVLDPGLGFAKRPEHSYAALKALPEFAALGRPLLVGPSRKSFLTAAIGERGVDDREFAKIGRASCRERDGSGEVAVIVR